MRGWTADTAAYRSTITETTGGVRCKSKAKHQTQRVTVDREILLKMVRAASALDFLTAAQKAAGQVEVQKLRAWIRSEYLVAQVLAWAKRAPGDPRVPEAYIWPCGPHATRRTAKTTQFSKQAFQLLHKQYPQSPWTKQTKYWY